MLLEQLSQAGCSNLIVSIMFSTNGTLTISSLFPSHVQPQFIHSFLGIGGLVHITESNKSCPHSGQVSIIMSPYLPFL